MPVACAAAVAVVAGAGWVAAVKRPADQSHPSTSHDSALGRWAAGTPKRRKQYRNG